MFHVEHDLPLVVRRAADWIGYQFDHDQAQVLFHYVDWLRIEAIPAGGLGPREPGRLWARHIADSLTFAIGAAEGTKTGLDVGSGVGLPGIPLAVLLPHVTFTLLDRSGRRCDLLGRAIRILGLGNVEVMHGAVVDVTNPHDLITLRASLTLPEALRAVPRVVTPGGSAVFGLSHRSAERPEAVEEAVAAGWDLIEIPREVLDSPARVLRMTAPPSAGGTDAVA